MTVPPNLSIANSPPETLADVREAMSRLGDFEFVAEHYADENSVCAFELLAVREALTIDDELLA